MRGCAFTGCLATLVGVSLNLGYLMGIRHFARLQVKGAA